jgi:hypothetical protein
MLREKQKHGASIMTLFEAGVFLTLVAGLMGLLVKAYEWRQDVLYGPYLSRDDQLDMR